LLISPKYPVCRGRERLLRIVSIPRSVLQSHHPRKCFLLQHGHLDVIVPDVRMEIKRLPVCTYLILSYLWRCCHKGICRMCLSRYQVRVSLCAMFLRYLRGLLLRQVVAMRVCYPSIPIGLMLSNIVPLLCGSLFHRNM